MSVLILAHDSDLVAGQVAAELTGREVPVSVLNPSRFPQQLSIHATMSNECCWSGSLRTTEGQEIALDSVRAVWHRRASQFVMDERMSPPERAFAYNEARRGLGGVLAALDGCLWINDPMAAMRAEYKPVQLAAATAAGLRIPDTVVTSDPDHAHAWATGQDSPIIYKPLSGVWHADEGQLKVMYTTTVSDPADLRDSALRRTAHLLQAQVPKAYEARAVIIQDRVFAARIDAASEAARIDWRSDYDALSYAPIDLPADLTRRLVDLHRRLGLVYGAVDLIRDTNGEWVFLETNQSGEFGWLAEAAELPIANAVADVLQGAL